MKRKIKTTLKRIVRTEWPGFDVGKIEVSYPKDKDFGDLTTNVAMTLASHAKKSPIEIASHIVKLLDSHIAKNDDVERVEVIQPGYINFHLSKKYFAQAVRIILKEKEDWGKSDSLKGKVFLAEHTDPNLLKEFHIGHMMTNAIGESLGRVARFCGAQVKQVTFQGDVGLHVAKTLWGMKELKNEMPRGDSDIWEKQAFMGRCYAWGERNYSEEKNNNAKKEIIEINKIVYSGKEIDDYKKGKEWSLEYFEKIYKILGSKFDHYFLESETFRDGERIVKENVGKVFEKSQGAIIFPGSEFNLHDRVFINSENLPTYEAKDIGLFHKKWEKYNPDISLTITGSEQREYFQVVKKAAGMINTEWEEKTIHVAHGTLRLASGKMSSRKGEIVRAKKWIDDTSEIILGKMKNDEIKDKEDVAKKIAIAAIKYSILKVMAGKDIVYDEEKSVSFEGDSGPYLQYTYVRANSIFRDIQNIQDVQSVKNVPKVGKTVLKFPEIVEKSLSDYSPHHLANYLHELASEFNSFYAHTRVLDEKNPDYQYNLALTKAVRATLKNGLYLLGIETVERM